MTSENSFFVSPRLTVSQFLPNSQVYLKNFICPICKGVFFNPIFDECGHTFCLSCYQACHNLYGKCPITKKNISAPPIPVLLISKILDKQLLYCINKEKGCKWKGALSLLNEHLQKDCLQEEIECPNEECKARIIRGMKDVHLSQCQNKNIECAYCKMKIKFNEIEKHLSECVKLKIECPQKCGELIEKENVDHHISNSCKMTPINCPFIKYGCNDKPILRKEIISGVHHDSIKHMDLVFTKINTLQSSLFSLAKEVQSIRSEFLVNLKNQLNALKSDEKPTPNCFPKENDLLVHKRNRSPLEIKMQTKEASKQNETIDLVKKSPLGFIPSLNNNGKQYQQGPFQIDQNIYDKINKSNKIYISGPIARYISTGQVEHVFVFGSRGINCAFDKGIFSWNITILTNPKWIAIGLCDKEEVLNNKMKFIMVNPKNKHGSFLVSSNQYSWNCLSEQENNMKISFPKMEKGSNVELAYDIDGNKLTFTSNYKSFTLSKVKPVLPEHKILTPCILFLNDGDSVKMNYNF